jgi:hypothetical protein
LAAGLAVACAAGLTAKRTQQEKPSNKLAPPAAQDWKSIAKSAAVGVGRGVVATAAVTGVALGAAVIGVPAIVVTGALGVAAVAGGAYTIHDITSNVKLSNWNNVAYDLGAIVGGIIVGAAGGGRLIADRVSPTPSTVPKSWNPLADLPWHYNPNYPGGSLTSWLGSGPTPQSGGGSAALAGSGASRWWKPKWIAK